MYFGESLLNKFSIMYPSFEIVNASLNRDSAMEK